MFRVQGSYNESVDRLPINLVLSRVTHYLIGLPLPASKPRLVHYADDRGADPGSIRLLQLLPSPKYSDMKSIRRDTSRVYRRLIAAH